MTACQPADRIPAFWPARGGAESDAQSVARIRQLRRRKPSALPLQSPGMIGNLTCLSLVYQRRALLNQYFIIRQMRQPAQHRAVAPSAFRGVPSNQFRKASETDRRREGGRRWGAVTLGKRAARHALAGLGESFDTSGSGDRCTFQPEVDADRRQLRAEEKLSPSQSRRVARNFDISARQFHRLNDPSATGTRGGWLPGHRR